MAPKKLSQEQQLKLDGVVAQLQAKGLLTPANRVAKKTSAPAKASAEEVGAGGCRKKPAAKAKSKPAPKVEPKQPPAKKSKARKLEEPKQEPAAKKVRAAEEDHAAEAAGSSTDLPPPHLRGRTNVSEAKANEWKEKAKKSPFYSESKGCEDFSSVGWFREEVLGVDVTWSNVEEVFALCKKSGEYHDTTMPELEAVLTKMLGPRPTSHASAAARTEREAAEERHPGPILEDPSLSGKSADHQKQKEGREGDDDAEGAEEEEPVEDCTVEPDTLVDPPEPEDSDNGNPKPAKAAKKADAIATEEAASPVVPPGQPQPPLLATPADKTVEEVCV